MSERPGCAGGSPGGPPGGHPVVDALRTVRTALAGVVEDRCWSLADEQVSAAVDEVQAAVAQLEELRLRLLATASSRDAGFMATSTAGWLAAHQRISRREAARAVRLGAALDGRYGQLRAALAGGAVNPEQAHVIGSALDRVPRRVGDQAIAAAEAWLIEQARTFGPDDLRRLGRRVYEVIDPDGADAAEGKALQEEEARAWVRTRMWMRPVGDGCTRGGFTVPDAQAEMLKAALDALVSPRRPRSGTHADDGDGVGAAAVAESADTVGQVSRTTAGSVDPDLDPGRLPYEQRLGQAFCELIEHLPTDRLPQSGRSTPTVVVELRYGALQDAVGAATLSSGGRISAGQARRLACTAGLLPMVLGTDSAVLDLGRESRLFTPAQRLALGKTQGGCVADGCERPPAWCEAHHIDPWCPDGRTDLDNGVLLCSWHHHLVHRPGWQVVRADDGVPELVPPARIDPNRRAIRHRRFRRRAEGVRLHDGGRPAARVPVRPERS